MAWAPTWPILAAVLVSGSGCDGSLSAGGDAGGEPALDANSDVEPDADGALDGPSDAGGDPQSGRLAVATSRAEATDERLCDLDGDGIGDNAFADLGSPHAELYMQLISTALAASVDSGDVMLLVFPWVDDLSVPEDGRTTLIIGHGLAVEDTSDPPNDPPGLGRFYMQAEYIDACGEPHSFDEDASIEAGVLTAGPFVLSMHIGEDVPWHTREVTGTIAPQGAHGSYSNCGYLEISDMGDARFGNGFSLLEVLAVGGAAAGIATLPGLDPDVDLDGDGLESFLIGDDDHIAGCVDGDSTIIEGADCWQDARMADGLSFNVRFEFVSARFEGPEPDWEEDVEGTCAEPPEQSLWDPS